MKDFPTIRVVGYDVGLSWVSLVKAALTDRPDLPVPPAETSVIMVYGEIAAPEFTITLKQQSSESDQRLFATLPHPHSPNDIILFVPSDPIDPLQQRTGWLRKEILDAITRAFLSTRMPQEDDPKIESLHDQTLPVDKDLEEAAARVQRELTLAFEEAERALQPTYDLTVYFHPDLSQEQIQKSFAAMADYYRACGGTGFRVEFEEQDVRVPEVAYDGRW